MITEELRNFVKKERGKGTTDTELKAKLEGEGWSSDDVTEVLSAAYSKSSNTVSAKKPDPNATDFKKKTIVLVVVIIALILGIFMMIFLSGSRNTGGEPVDVSQTQETGDAAGLETKYVSDCGGKECFEENFANCIPSNIDIFLETVGSVNYTIIGPTDSGCEMAISYSQSSNQDLDGKSLTCVFDNTLDSDIAVAEVFKKIYADDHSCSGSLVDVLKGGNVYNPQ